MPPQEPALLEGRDQPMDAGFGPQVQRVLHFLKTRRAAGLAQMLIDKNQQLVLFRGQHGASSSA